MMRLFRIITSWYRSYKNLDTILWFGKHKGLAIQTVIDVRPTYVDWCLDKKIFRLNISAKLYHRKAMSKHCKMVETWHKVMSIAESKYGRWLDDGKGNCGFEFENGQEYY